jgi:SHS family lactate transporter-like MFS transporter
MSDEGDTSKRDALPPEDPADVRMGLGRFLATRLPTLKPPMNYTPNPISLLRLLNRKQWLFFFVGFLGWTWDAFDFFTHVLSPMHARHLLTTS